MTKRVVLRSDFIDYYDHHFDLSYFGEYVEFKRFSEGGMSRYEMLFYMAGTLGLRTPRFDRRDRALMWNKPLVLHLFPMAHRGQGKHRFRPSWDGSVTMEVVKTISRSDTVAVEYIDPADLSTSYRLLCVGALRFELRYTSNNAWLSNVGEVEIEILKGRRLPEPRLQEHPLVAIDFILGRDNVYYAIDYNVAPQIRGTGVEGILEAKEAAGRIKDFIWQRM